LPREGKNLSGVNMRPKFDEANGKRWDGKRKSLRNSVRIIADLLISAGPRFKVSVIDLSQTGFRIETGERIDEGTRVYLTIPGFESLQARVAWNSRNCYGCEFARPLYPSIFEHIAQKHPSLVS
jgi:PilZ domain